MAAWRRRLDELEDQSRDPIQPQYLMRVVDRCAAPTPSWPPDSGTVATWSARHFDVRGDRHYLLSANLATIAAGVPYAIAAQWAHPGRACIAVTGSDGFAKVMGELLTAIQYRLPVKVVVSNTSSLGHRLRAGGNGTPAARPTSPLGQGQRRPRPPGRARRRGRPGRPPGLLRPRPGPGRRPRQPEEHRPAMAGGA